MFRPSLTPAEWLEVKRIESSRLKALGGSLFSFPDDPKDFTITVRATVKPVGPGRVLVIVDYEMASEAWRKAGVRVTPHAPPTAVRLGAVKFWRQLELETQAASLPAPRKRRWDEVT